MRAVEQSANFVIITDANGVISYVNPAFLKATGYMADEVIGARPSLWRSGQTGEPTYAALWETIRAGNDWHGEFQNRRKDGSLVSVSAVISPIKDESGRITHFIGIQEDVTQRREMEAQLRHAQRIETIGRLTGGLAHDFNNLLTVVIGNLELLEHRLAADPTARQLAAMAGKAAERGAELTRQLLAFARRQPLTAKAFDVNALVAGTTNLLRRTLGEQINVRMMLADDLSHAFADPTQVESALTNLAINSRDAMPGGGRLTIETANQRLDERYAAENLDVAPGDYVMLAVSDTGTGMPPEILSRVFEPFFTTKAEGKGSGLGLSMVYGFAKQSRGHVKIYSEVGHGTTVRLYLPRAAGNAAAAADATAADAESATIEATILVVEDNADVRRVAVGMLADLGCRVIEAENAAAALAILVTGQPIDLLFTDIVMPGGMTGVELAREARKLRAGLKVLFTSGFADAPLRNGGEADENKNLLRKPYRKPELARWIRRILAGNGPRS
jgi:PAS domain S-box-containing protein